jgi:AcrR family transcriptional regulator
MARPVDPNRPALEEKILLAAARMFAERGYGATSVGDIAKAVGLHKSSLYHYIKGKRPLLFQALCQNLAVSVQLLEAVAASEGTPYERLKRAVESVVADMLGRPYTVAIFLRDRRALTAQQVREYVAMRDRYEKVLKRLITEAVERDGCRPLDPSIAVKALMGMCNWIVQWYRPDGRLGPAEMAAEYSAMFVDRLLYEGRMHDGTRTRRGQQR